MILVKIGSNLIPDKSFIDKLIGKNFEDVLVEQTGILRQRLAAQSVFLPNVHYEEDSTNPNLLQISFGLKKYIYNSNNVINEHDLLNIIQKTLTNYQIKGELSSEAIKRLVMQGNEALSKRKYNDAIDNYDKAYYLASLIDNTPTILDNVIIALFNVGYINYINNHLIDAYDCAQILQNIVDNPGFYDPVIRYHAHMFKANLLWLFEDDSAKIASIQFFQECVNDVKQLGEPRLSMFASWNIILACFAIGEETSKICKETLNNMLDIARNNDQYFPAEYRVRIHDIKDYVMENKVQQLEEENSMLQEDFNCVAAQLSVQNSFRERIVFAGKIGGQLLLNFCALYGVTKPNNTTNITGSYNNVTNSIVASLISRR